MELQPNFCDGCHAKIQPEEEVVQALEQVQAGTFGDGTQQWLDGHGAIFHPGHFPPPIGRWREVYRGPLRGIRAAAT